MTFGGARADQSLDQIEGFLAAIASDVSLAGGLRMKDVLDFGELPGVERAPLRVPNSSTPIAAKARQLIISCEVSSKADYQREYEGPTWPKGASGVTIGIGYDVGYVSPTDLAQDWAGILSQAELSALSAACGVKGNAAAALLPQMRSLSVGWDDAIKEYDNETQPRYVGLTEALLPNTKDLTPESLGALVSLVYNRGGSFSIPESKDPTGRYREMRNIKARMAAKDYGKIPGELTSMKRLWEGMSDMRGLLLRRDAEAALFAYGLSLQHK
jgi:GH24 family phage-related lysozyme (muramidase)